MPQIQWMILNFCSHSWRMLERKDVTGERQWKGVVKEIVGETRKEEKQRRWNKKEQKLKTYNKGKSRLPPEDVLLNFCNDP